MAFALSVKQLSSKMQLLRQPASSTSLRCIDAAETTKLVSSITRLPFVNIINMKWTLKCWLANLSTVQTKVAETFSFFFLKRNCAVILKLPVLSIWLVSPVLLQLWCELDCGGIYFHCRLCLKRSVWKLCWHLDTQHSLCLQETTDNMSLCCISLETECTLSQITGITSILQHFPKLLQGCGKCKQRHLNVKLSWKY